MISMLVKQFHTLQAFAVAHQHQTIHNVLQAFKRQNLANQMHLRLIFPDVGQTAKSTIIHKLQERVLPITNATHFSKEK